MPAPLSNLGIPSSILQHTRDIKDSSIAPPIAPVPIQLDYNQAVSVISQMWENSKYKCNDSFKLGMSFVPVEIDAPYYDLVNGFLQLIFTSIKDQLKKSTPSIDVQQQQITLINAIHKAIQADLNLLKLFTITINTDVLLAAISGYMLKNTGQALTTHRK